MRTQFEKGSKSPKIRVKSVLLLPLMARRLSKRLLYPPRFLRHHTTQGAHALEPQTQTLTFHPPPDRESIVSIFKSYNFVDAQIQNLFSTHPKLPYVDILGDLQPKLQILANSGLAQSQIQTLLIRHPRIFHRTITTCNNLKPSVLLLKTVVGGDNMPYVFQHHGWLLTSPLFILRALHNTTALVKNGVPPANVSWLVMNRPGVLSRGIPRFLLVVELANEFGISPDSPEFLDAVFHWGVVGDVDVLKKKELFTGMGWSEDEFVDMVRRVPSIMASSLKKIKMLLDLLAGRLPPVLTQGKVGGTILGKLKVLLILKEKRLVPKDGVGLEKLVSALFLKNSAFRDRFVKPYIHRAPQLKEIKWVQNKAFSQCCS